MEQIINDFIKRYDAFVKLYTVDYDEILKLYELESKKEELVTDVNYLIEGYNKKVGDAGKWEKKYAERAKHYNDAKHLAGVDSFSEKVDRRYAESAQEMSSAATQDALKIKGKIDELKKKIKAIDKEQTAIKEGIGSGTMQYQNRAFETAASMCSEYPYSPVGYLLTADFYLYLLSLERELIEYGRKKFYLDSYILELLDSKEKNSDWLAKATSERAKANKFLDDETRLECKTIISRVDAGIRKEKKLAKEASEPLSEEEIKRQEQNKKQLAKTKKLEEKVRRYELDNELDDRTSSEKAGEERKARYKFWLKASIGVIAVGVIAFVVWFFFFR